MMAIALIPITALGGSGVDIARVYMVKNRLQQACDAGVLAGRKFMDDTKGTTLDEKATKQANAFFLSNVANGWLGITDAKFTPHRTGDNRVAGDAQVVVPMTVMKMFGAPDVTLAVACEARLDIADTDVMFVLDTTGSMMCLPSESAADCEKSRAESYSYDRPGSSTADTTPGYAGSKGYALKEKRGSRIAALRTAVIDFYDTMETAKQANTRIRYGFVPYATGVNAGAAIRAMSASYLVGSNGRNDTATYQTRHIVDEYRVRSTSDRVRVSRESCEAFVPVRDPATRLTFDSEGNATLTTREWDSDRERCTETRSSLGPVWAYEPYALDVSDYILAASARNSTRIRPTDNAWLGCIEETDRTTSGSRQFDANSLPPNLDPSLKPSGQDRWQPLWPEVAYSRYYNNNKYRGTLYSQGEINDYYWLGSDGNLKAGLVSCGKPVQRLSALSRDQVRTYINDADFSPLGGTEHDTGMLWALRLLSRDGIFASDNGGQGSRSAAKQVIVFLTDGDMSPNDTIYGLYGMEYWDRRIANGDSDLKPYHNARFLALCDKARAMGIDVWTVALSMGSTAELKSCASSSDQALATTSGTGLSDAFKKIAKAVAMLRISR